MVFLCSFRTLCAWINLSFYFVPLLILILLLSVASCSREGGLGWRHLFAFPNLPVQVRRRYKTKTYITRRRFTTALMMFHTVTNTTVTLAGTVDRGRTPYTLTRLPQRRRRLKPKQSKRPKGSSRRETQTNDAEYDTSDHGVYLPRSWTIPSQQESLTGPDR